MSAEVSGLHIRGKAALAINMPADTPPPGWVWVPLNVVARQETGHTPSRQHPEWWGGDVAWIGLRDARLHHGTRIYETQQTINALGLANSSARLLPAGTVCLSRTASVGYVTIMGRAMATSQDFVTWTCSEALLPDFLMKALIAEGDDIRKFGKGTTHTTIYFPEVRAMHICLPPPAEQKRIVAELNALTAKSARARAEIARIDTLVSRYKQAVLAQAFSEEPASAAIGTRWDERLLEELIVDGPTNGWSPVANDASIGVRSLKLSATSTGELVLDQSTVKYIDQKVPATSKYWLVPDDILIQRANSLELLGTTVLFDGPANEYIFPDLMMRVRADRSLVLPKFLSLHLNSDGTRAWFRSRATGTAGNMPKINGQTVRAVRVPVPPLPEQHEIVRRIESAFARIDRLGAEAKRALALLGKLDEAILAKAFRGELVPQDPADEPASVLLERISAERAAAPKVRRRRRSAASDLV